MVNDLQKKEFLKLENRIWKTYQSRIKAATRLKEMSNKLDFYSIYYTIALSILSVFSLIILMMFSIIFLSFCPF